MIYNRKKQLDILSRLNNYSKIKTLDIPIFTPSCKQQEEFYNSKKRIQLLVGANQSGKSEVGGAKMARIMRENPGSLSWSVAKVYPMTRICHEKIMKYIHPDEIDTIVWSSSGKKIPYSIQMKNGAENIYKSMDSELHTFEGATITGGIWIDEECTDKQKWGSCIARTTMSGAPLLMTMSALQGRTWVYYDIWKSDAEHVLRRKMTLYDNSYLDPISRDQQIALYSAEEIPYRVMGEWGMLEGRIYRTYSEDVHKITITKNIIDKLRIIMRGIDFGRTLACVWVGLDAYERAFIIKDLQCVETPLEDFANAIYSIEQEIGIADRITDTVTDHQFQERLELERFGIYCSLADKKVDYGINIVRRRFKIYDGSSYIHDNLPNSYLFVGDECGICDDLMTYQYKSVKGDKEPSGDPLKKDDHRCDAMRYAIVALEEYCSKQFGGEIPRIDSVVKSVY